MWRVLRRNRKNWLSSRSQMTNPIVEIYLGRLVHNYKLIKDRVGNAEVLAVVKADGYGHGAVPVSQALEKVGVNYFGVFSIGEALELRNAAIKGEIIMFERLTREAVPLAVEHAITVNVSWFGDLDLFEEISKKGGPLPKYHIKVDTGMTRLGIPHDEVASVTDRILDTTGQQPEGIYTHLSTSDEGDLSFAYEQKTLFEDSVDQIRGICSPNWIHIANSGALVNMPDSFYNMVRVGMLFYGAKPSEEMINPLSIEPVMNFKGKIVLVRSVEAGTPISYGALYRPETNITLGVVQVGFADGMPRPWFERGFVGWKGGRYKIAGRICMDQFMVDFGDSEPSEGDTVLIWGKDDENAIPVEEISKDIGLNPYTLFTAMSGKRIERIYLNE